MHGEGTQIPPKNTPANLSDAAIRALKPREKPYKTFDGACKGLYLITNPGGSRLWRMRYWFESHEKVLALGPYPAIGLKDARQRVLEARGSLARGEDPGEIRRAEKVAKTVNETTFKSVAEEWLSKKTKWSPGYADAVKRRLEQDIYPWLGDRPIANIEPPELLAAFRRVETRGALELAHRVMQYCSGVFRYAIATGAAKRDPTVDLRGALATGEVKHRAALVDPAAVGGLMRAIDGYQGSFVVACALRLAPLVFVRPGELRKAQWSEINLDGAEWRIPGRRMKMREIKTHVVPLSRQAVTILRELQPLTGAGTYVFPSERTAERPMSDNTINAALRRLGYAKEQMTGHGFRAMASSLLNELGYRSEIVERQLAHAERNKIRAAYNRTEYLQERRAMMQAWADYLDGLK